MIRTTGTSNRAGTTAFVSDAERAASSLARAPRISCIHLVDLVDYFADHRAVTTTSALAGLRLDEAALRDPGAWCDNYDTFLLHRNCHRTVPGLAHRDWFDVGLVTYMRRKQGALRILMGLVSVDVLYRSIARLVPRTSRFCEYGVLDSSAGRIRLSFRVIDPRVLALYTFGTECWYDLGVFASLPRLQGDGQLPAKASHPVCGMPMGIILQNCYGLDASRWSYGPRGVTVEGRLVARWVRLEESASTPGAFTTGYSFAPRGSANAVVVVRDALLDGRAAFGRGEIYDAPHCIFDLRFSNRPLYGRIAGLVGLGGARHPLGRIPAESAADAAPRVGAAPRPLTPREGEVARLVSGGLRNADIARRLFISPETVKRHVANIFAKLSVRNRVELARVIGLGGRRDQQRAEGTRGAPATRRSSKGRRPPPS